jgi:exodeoxyribonuclease V alpha subunit
MTDALLDKFDVRFALGAPEPLRAFNQAGVLAAADVHAALRVGALAGVADPACLLALALAVRAPRLGHVHVDLASIARTAAVDGEATLAVGELPWPEPEGWRQAVGDSPLVAGPVAPLRLEGSWLAVERMWAAEVRLAERLTAQSVPAPGLDRERAEAGLNRLFAPRDADQRFAAAVAAERRLAVIAGGPGTGKTTTVARIIALLGELAQASGRRLPRVALAAPTGKASARLAEAVHTQAPQLDVEPAIRDWLRSLEAMTLHRLLGLRPGGRPRFDAEQRLPHDVVVVDESSMVSLALMERLAAAVRPEARLILVGDPGQLASIEAGAVLGDVVGPAAPPPGAPVPPIAESIAVLSRGHRFGSAIDSLARAVRDGDADQTLRRLERGDEGITWIPEPDSAAAETALRGDAVAAGEAVLAAAVAGDGPGALAALERFRILAAHRRGPYGVSTLTARVLGWLEAALPGFTPDERFFVGRPLLLTENDRELGLFNGDTGVVVRTGEDRLAAAFERRGEVVAFSPARLGAVDTVYAMTIHKSQGSQFRRVDLVLPPPDSRLLTRELLYTALTRAQEEVLVIGSPESVRIAVDRPIARASGLRRRLWH